MMPILSLTSPQDHKRIPIVILQFSCLRPSTSNIPLRRPSPPRRLTGLIHNDFIEALGRKAQFAVGAWLIALDTGIILIAEGLHEVIIVVTWKRNVRVSFCSIREGVFLDALPELTFSPNNRFRNGNRLFHRNDAAQTGGICCLVLSARVALLYEMYATVDAGACFAV